MPVADQSVLQYPFYNQLFIPVKVKRVRINIPEKISKQVIQMPYRFQRFKINTNVQNKVNIALMPGKIIKASQSGPTTRLRNKDTLKTPIYESYYYDYNRP